MEVGCDIKQTNVIVARTHKWCQDPCEGMWPKKKKKEKKVVTNNNISKYYYYLCTT